MGDERFAVPDVPSGDEQSEPATSGEQNANRDSGGEPRAPGDIGENVKREQGEPVRPFTDKSDPDAQGPARDRSDVEPPATR
jgi:hypothetical protein